MRAACFFTTASLSLPSTSTPTSAASASLRKPTSLRCFPPRRGGVVRALDERLLEAAPAPAETEAEEPGTASGYGGGEEEGEGDGVSPLRAQGEEEGEQPPPRAPVRSRRRQQEEEAATAGYDRFKLINGREILQEKAYLVGVECKKTGGNIFGIEESLKELEQLADTAGLLVVGSTYQKYALDLQFSKSLFVEVEHVM